MENGTVIIGLAGDVMIGRGVDRIVSQKGYSYPWGNTLPLLHSTDLNIINLETTLTYSNKIVPKVFNFKASPDKIKTLTEANITLVNLANNHILDFSEEGLTETIHALDGAGIKHAGAGMNDEEAAKPVIIPEKNILLGLLGFTDNEYTWRAGVNKYGINYINVSKAKDKERACAAIQQLRKEVDILIVSIHWGPNMREEPSFAFIDFAHEMIHDGTDIIHGHSAHIFQGIEIYKNKLILYDTGDFVDDYLVDAELRNDHSFFFLAEVNKTEIKRLKIIPVLISRYQVNLAKNADYKWSIRRMQHLSQKFGTKISDDGEVMLIRES